MIRSALALACAALLCGCFTFRSTLAVRPDGSATLTETLALSGPARRAMSGAAEPLSTPAALQARAFRLGAGVTVVRSDTAGGVRTTVYAVPDVAALQYRLPDNASEPADLASVAGVPPLYTFAFEPSVGGGPSVLRIVTPDELPPAPRAAPDTAAVQRSLELTRVLMAGARATVEVVALGVPVSAEGDALMPEAATATLVDLRAEPLLNLVERHPDLAAGTSVPLGLVRRYLDGTDGLVVQPPGTVAIRFR